MRGLLLSSALYSHASVFYEAFAKMGISCDLCFVSGPQYVKYDITCGVVPFIDYKTAITSLNKYDFVIGLDSGCSMDIARFKTINSGILSICQFLDYPCHVLGKDSPFYSERAFNNWKVFIEALSAIDVVISNFDVTSEILPKNNINAKFHTIYYPVQTVKFEPEEYSRQDYILYIGRMSLDKGLHHVISALSLLKNRPKLVSVSTDEGKEVKLYAEYLGVDFENFQNLSELEKWKKIYECRFTVCGSLAWTIPPLVLTEGMSVGRTGVCFAHDAYIRHYKDMVLYANAINIGDFADKIRYLIENPYQADKFAECGPEFCASYRSIENWISKVSDILEDYAK